MQYAISANVDVGGWENEQDWCPIVAGTLNGHDWIDLGLPSGIKWATCNVGASSPEDYGNYYAWGETSTKSSYNYDNSTTYGKEMSDIGGNASYDVARKQWGSTWRLPTEAECRELRVNCTCDWAAQNGVYGFKLTSKVNGQSIFLPAAGYRSGTSLDNASSRGYYWSSTPSASDTYDAYYLHLYNFSLDDSEPDYVKSASFYVITYLRSKGISIRPVTE